MKNATTVTFKGKIREVPYTDGTLAARYVQIPQLSPSHVDMNAARGSRLFGNYANSQLFMGMLKGHLKRIGGVRERGESLCVDLLKPLDERCKVDASGFLAVVLITIPDIA